MISDNAQEHGAGHDGQVLARCLPVARMPLECAADRDEMDERGCKSSNRHQRDVFLMKVVQSVLGESVWQAGWF